MRRAALKRSMVAAALAALLAHPMAPAAAAGDSMDSAGAFGIDPIRPAPPAASRVPDREDFARVRQAVNELAVVVRDPEVEALVAAAAVGRLEQVRAALDAGVDPDARPLARASTALAEAVRRGDVAMARLLLQRGARPDRAAIDGVRALSLAIASGREALLQRLLAAGASVNERDATGHTPLALAAAYDRRAAMRILHAAGAQIDLAGRFGPPIVVCAERGLPGACAQLLRLGADVNATDAGGRSALFFATQRQDRALGRLLLASGAEPGAIYVGWLED